MSVKTFSASIFGFDCRLVEVEVDILNGPASITIVGLGDASVQESKERIRSAIKNSGFEYPRRKKTINLAPADLRKHGPMFDLPIALGLLLQSQQIPQNCLEDSIAIGELSLDGNLRRVAGVLPMVAHAKIKGFKTAIVPIDNAKEAAVVPGINVIGAKNLRELIIHLCGDERISPEKGNSENFKPHSGNLWRLEDVRGHEYAKRALTIAAAGAHNILLYGPPGSGKTLLARSVQSILPPLSFDEAVEVTEIYSVAGKLPPGESLIQTPPFRSVHHTASTISLIGGGAIPRPGEISLAHRGALFIDELLEFPHASLDALRQPMEDGVVNVTRVAGSCTFPAEFILIAATNPCPCGYFGDSAKPCICKPSQLQQYRKKLSGPILDRIDLMCYVPRLPFEKISIDKKAETSQNILAHVSEARKIQRSRYLYGNDLTHDRSLAFSNGKISSSEIKKHCELDNDAHQLFKDAFSKMHCSGRAYYRILKVARTIADLDNSTAIKTNHLAEALQYRPRMGTGI